MYTGPRLKEDCCSLGGLKRIKIFTNHQNLSKIGGSIYPNFDHNMFKNWA